MKATDVNHSIASFSNANCGSVKQNATFMQSRSNKNALPPNVSEVKMRLSTYKVASLLSETKKARNFSQLQSIALILDCRT
jgi:hypothetical protein